MLLAYIGYKGTKNIRIMQVFYKKSAYDAFIMSATTQPITNHRSETGHFLSIFVKFRPLSAF